MHRPNVSYSLQLFAALTTFAVVAPACGTGEIDDTKDDEILILYPDAGRDMLATAPDAGRDGADGSVPGPDMSGEVVTATIRVLDPATGAGTADVAVTGPAGMATTDAQGRATVTVEPGRYRIALDALNTRRHTVFGVATDADFEQITYVSSEMITNFVYGQLGLTDDSTRGILVVGLDRPDLSPAVGASATIDADSDEPFVFSGSRPVQTREIPPAGQGFVTFPNTAPGEVTITTSFPSGSCRIFPAETDADTVEVVAGEVTVIAFTCTTD